MPAARNRTPGALSRLVFGAPPAGALPRRIQQAIARQQVDSEILIGWVQLALLALLGVLYAVSPKASAGTMFEPVPWTLGLYGVFTLGRLWLAHRQRLARPVVLLSIVADVALLLILIWMFHIQYHQPAAFYLKVPTLLYVFLFIALRALRFEPGYVIVAGVTAAAGWLAMLVYALVDPIAMGENITRDYVAYMTSNMILIGAEIDKVVSILAVTAVLAVALVRARRLLIRAVADGQAAEDLTRFVAPDVARRIATGEVRVRAGDGEVKQASIMFTDIEGFSTLSERLAPAELVSALNAYFGAVAEAVGRFGGTISQFHGDAMLIVFNTAAPDADHAANALRAALAIQDLTRDTRFGEGVLMRTRCGVNTGEIVSGAVGSAERLIHTVHGDEVNVAARLEQLNKTYGSYILATEQTVAAAGPGFACERVADVVVRGRSRPTGVYKVSGPPGADAGPGEGAGQPAARPAAP